MYHLHPFSWSSTHRYSKCTRSSRCFRYVRSLVDPQSIAVQLTIYLSSLMQLNHAYVTSIGRLVGLVGLKDVSDSSLCLENMTRIRCCMLAACAASLPVTRHSSLTFRTTIKSIAIHVRRTRCRQCVRTVGVANPRRLIVCLLFSFYHCTADKNSYRKDERGHFVAETDSYESFVLAL